MASRIDPRLSEVLLLLREACLVHQRRLPLDKHPLLLLGPRPLDNHPLRLGAACLVTLLRPRRLGGRHSALLRHRLLLGRLRQLPLGHLLPRGVCLVVLLLQPSALPHLPRGLLEHLRRVPTPLHLEEVVSDPPLVSERLRLLPLEPHLQGPPLAPHPRPRLEPRHQREVVYLVNQHRHRRLGPLLSRLLELHRTLLPLGRQLRVEVACSVRQRPLLHPLGPRLPEDYLVLNLLRWDKLRGHSTRRINRVPSKMVRAASTYNR